VRLRDFSPLPLAPRRSCHRMHRDHLLRVDQ
jgi:hypothetical protein